mgnify:CR=1 FL=1
MIQTDHKEHTEPPTNPSTETLLESLDNVSAALETCLTWFGKDMTKDCRKQQWQICNEARKLVSTMRGEA